MSTQSQETELPMIDSGEDTCFECGGKCCSFRELDIEYANLEPEERYDTFFLEDSEHMNHEQLVFDDGTVPDMRWYVVTHPDGRRSISFECMHLTEEGLCGVYDKRPSMCRSFECPAIDEDQDIDLDEFLEEYSHGDDGVPDDYSVREVTERVHEILERRSQEESWGE